MKFTRKALALSILAATASMSAQAVIVDADDRGQLLLAPAYVAGPGQETEIRIVNPDQNIAVKAHVSFRSGTSSLDLINFILYLTPGDEWVGTVSNIDGKPTLKSSDDSILVDITPANAAPTAGVFGSFANPAQVPFFTERLGDNEKGNYGHIEVLGVYAVDDGNGFDSTNTVTGGKGNTNPIIYRGMPKSTLFNIDNKIYLKDSFFVGNVNKRGLYDGYLPVNRVDSNGDKDHEAAIPNTALAMMQGNYPVITPANLAAPGTVATLGTNVVGSTIGFAVPAATATAAAASSGCAASINGASVTPAIPVAAPAAASGSAWLAVGDVYDDPNEANNQNGGDSSERYCLSTTDNRIQLYGEVTLKMSANTSPSVYKMVALDDDPATPYSGVIENPLFDVVAQNDVPLGVRMGAWATTANTGAAATTTMTATDNIDAINRALATHKWIGGYDSLYPSTNGGDTVNVPAKGDAESMVVVTFPTKYRHVIADSFLSVNELNAGTTIDYFSMVNDNASNSGSSRNTVNFDATTLHYDYDYGYTEALKAALNGFDDGGLYPNTAAQNITATNANANANGDFIYGQKNVSCDKLFIGGGDTALTNRRPVSYGVNTYDTEENSYVALTTGVISGGIGSGASSVLPDEVNLVTDANNSLWYSTKGWYSLVLSDVNSRCQPVVNTAVNSLAVPAATGLNLGRYATPNSTSMDTTAYNAPSIVMTITTDAMGGSRIVPALDATINQNGGAYTQGN